MTDSTVVSEKFTVTYKRRFSGDGSVGSGGLADWFLGYDDSNSDGRPSFEYEPADEYLRNNLADAIKDAGMMETNMQTYYGHEHVDFGSIRVVRYQTVIETIDNLAEAHREALIKSATEKLSTEELAAIRYIFSDQQPIG